MKRGTVTVLGCMAMLLLASANRSAADPLACRRAVGSQSTRFLAKAASIMQKCEDRQLLAPIPSCPAPRDVLRLDRLRSRFHRVIASACADGVPAEFPASCPDPCAGGIVDGDALAACILCLAETSAVHFLGYAYPAPTVAITIAPTPRSSPTATVAAPGFCGDGHVGAGEQCDPPDDVACPGRCGAPSGPGACACPPAQSCTDVGQPPTSCTTDGDCPPPYTCGNGACHADTCLVKADCPAGGQCVYSDTTGAGTCVCRGCESWDCLLGCDLRVVLLRGCRCTELNDCPPEDDVCFLGICS